MPDSSSLTQQVASVCLAAAVLHSFFARKIELTFAFWAALYVTFLTFNSGLDNAFHWLMHLNFSEAFFIFVIMIFSATRPITQLAGFIIEGVSRLLPLHRDLSFFLCVLIIGPLLGSFITEPAAMTLSAILLREKILSRSLSLSPRLLYASVAVLFVNVSIGGILTSFAAPPVLMVARVWNWDSSFMFSNFGIKSILAVILNASLVTFMQRKELTSLNEHRHRSTLILASPWLTAIHVLFITSCVLLAHQPALVFGLFCLFLFFVRMTPFVQTRLKLHESLLVSLFLASLIVLTAEQGWWIRPLLSSLQDFMLYASAAVLTAFTDNAALTSLAAQATDLSDSSKYAIVAGAVVGGGLTVIANAPNPAGYALLKDLFPNRFIQAWPLFVAALIPTLIAGVLLWI